MWNYDYKRDQGPLKEEYDAFQALAGVSEFVLICHENEFAGWVSQYLVPKGGHHTLHFPAFTREQE